MLIRTQDGAAIISAETAAYLEKYAGLAALRVKARGVLPQVAADLTDIREAAEVHRRRSLPVLPEEQAGCPEVVGESGQWLTPTEVADMAMVTDKAVRLACREGRIAADFVDNRWQISRSEATGYVASRRR